MNMRPSLTSSDVRAGPAAPVLPRKGSPDEDDPPLDIDDSSDGLRHGRVRGTEQCRDGG
jgi:hypothetical protein